MINKLNSDSVIPQIDQNKSIGKTILIIEDQEELQAIEKRMLESKGYNILTANNGEDGLRIYKENAELIRLVLLDPGLPGISGKEVLKELIKYNTDVIVIISSGGGEIAQYEGVKDFILKPFAKIDILKIIEENIGK